jgi:hypothetical protein
MHFFLHSFYIEVDFNIKKMKFELNNLMTITKYTINTHVCSNF